MKTRQRGNRTMIIRLLILRSTYNVSVRTLKLSPGLLRLAVTTQKHFEFFFEKESAVVSNFYYPTLSTYTGSICTFKISNIKINQFIYMTHMNDDVFS